MGKDVAAGGESNRRPPPPPPMPLGLRLQLIGLSAAIDAVERRDGTVNRALYSVLVEHLMSVRADPSPDAATGAVRSFDFTIDAARGLWARVFAPAAAAPAATPMPVMVYYHGGGFALFSPAVAPFDGVCRRLCGDVGVVVVSVNYRLAPEHRYPAAYDDGVDALRFLDGNGIPGLDGDDVPAFLPVGADRDHPAAHVTDENAELAEAFPPAMVVIGGFDPLKDWQWRYVDVLRRKGKAVEVAEFPDAFHGFYGFPELADAGKVLQDMKVFVQSNRAARATA
uniref:Alpha/beta hydrolase fold-3 domain-containing protein n=1 Tax=Oryza barthii TaxID=65489 RepID=A0A0D3GU63_9ORYZ